MEEYNNITKNIDIIQFKLSTKRHPSNYIFGKATTLLINLEMIRTFNSNINFKHKI